MDLQFWIWLIVIAITFLARARKKKPDPAPRERQYRETNDQDSEKYEPESKPVTFEDLLREIQASKAPVKPQPAVRPMLSPPPPARSLREPVNYDNDLEEVTDYDPEVLRERDARAMEVYEKSKRQAFVRPSLEETMKLEDTDLSYSHFKGYELAKDSGILKGYIKELRDKEGFKKAFIMSEILNRRF